uniref:ORF320 n=1 Tax=Leptospirillum ferrooxidans TaxID=180 RepID=Q58KH0_9BACT|nr:hypothetical protein [Leptospirillum ferrooxidans]AAX36056.1 ORF320 [Leptospirillum ferrooxidans]
MIEHIEKEKSQVATPPPAAITTPSGPPVAPTVRAQPPTPKKPPAPEKNDKKKLVRKVFGLSSGTVHHSRLPIFAATRRPTERIQWIFENSWGTAEVTGKLGQNHRDLHDLVMTEGIEYKQGLQRELYVTIDPYDIQKKMGITPTNLNYIYELLEDMKRSDVRIKYKGGGDSLGGIVSNIDREYKAIPGPGGCVLERYLWLITMNQTWMKLYDTSIKVRCKPALDIILQMRSGYSQAVARFSLTHGQGMVIKFSDIVKALGIEMEAKLVKQEMKPDAELLSKLGLTFGPDGTIRYEKKEGMVSFENPLPGKSSTGGNPKNR